MRQQGQARTLRPVALTTLLTWCILLATTTITLADNFFPREYAGLLDGGAHLPCIKYFLLRAEAGKCRGLASDVQGVKAEVCSTVAGPMLALYSPEQARNVFSARVVGPQVALLPLSSCYITERDELTERQEGCDESDPEHISATYGLMTGLVPGRYTLDVTMMYSGFSYGKGKMVVASDGDNVTLHVMTEVVTVHSPDPEDAAAASALLGASYADCSYCEDRCATWPTCKTPNLEGSWLTDIEVNDETDERPFPYHLATMHDTAKVRWQPKGCRFEPLSTLDMDACLEEGQKHVCFVGDSHIRHMFNGFVSAVKHPGDGQAPATVPDDAVYAFNGTDKGVSYHPNVTYLEDHFGEGWVGPNLSICTHVIFSFAQWPLSHQPPSRWSASHYARVLHTLLNEIQAYRKENPLTRFFWASTNSRAANPLHMACLPGLDHRTSPFTDMFNAVASGFMEMYGVPQINTGSITSHVTDLAYDGTHYHWLGSAGHAMTEYVANVICVQG